MATQTFREKTLLALTIGLAIGLIFAGIGLYSVRSVMRGNTVRVTALEHDYAVTRSQLQTTEGRLELSRRRQDAISRKFLAQRTYSRALAKQVHQLGATPVSMVTVVDHDSQGTSSTGGGQPMRHRHHHHSHHHSQQHPQAPRPTPTPTPTPLCVLGITCL